MENIRVEAAFNPADIFAGLVQRTGSEVGPLEAPRLPENKMERQIAVTAICQLVSFRRENTLRKMENLKVKNQASWIGGPHTWADLI